MTRYGFWIAGLCFVWPLLFSSKAQAQTCGKFASPSVTGNLQQSKLKESSGLALSRKNPGVFWSHNDSGGKPRLFAFDAKGKGLGTFLLDGATNVDWEDMAAAPCPDGSPCLYVADVGDNLQRRNEIVIYRFKEPKADDSTAGKETTITGVEVFKLRYPDTAHNCETLLVHPKTRDILLVTKTLNRTSKIFGLAGDKRPGTHILESKGTLTTSEAFLTGGDWSPSGKQVVIRGYTTAFVYTVGSAAVPEDKHMTQGFELAKTAQGEAITFSLDGKSLWTTTEKLPAPIHQYTCSEWKAPPEPVKEPSKEITSVDGGTQEDGGKEVVVDVPPPSSSCSCEQTSASALFFLWLPALLLWGVRIRRRQVS
jgi:hypothetical protein